MTQLKQCPHGSVIETPSREWRMAVAIELPNSASVFTKLSQKCIKINVVSSLEYTN